ncbi:MAG: cas3 [Firmicutes bacterium]|nr:cas3 [Bacillota bacterium]
MQYSFLAKSNPLQTITEHTQDALKCYESLRKAYPNILCEEDWCLLKDAVLFHDLGKMDIKFQNKIRQSLKLVLILDKATQREEIPHNVLSCSFLDRKRFKEKYGAAGYEVLTKAIYYHHARERKLEEEDKEYIKTILQDCRNQFSWDLIDIPERLDRGDVYTRVTFDNSKTHYDEMLQQYIMVKGLLNRIDYAASAGLDEIEESGGDLQQIVTAAFIDKGYQLRPVQEYMLANQEENLVAVAATGCGKTEAALLWLGKSKGFYTLPLKVSINAIFQRVKEDIGYHKVSLLHSDALTYQLHEQDGTDFETAHQAYTCAKLFAKPLTISTIDQLLKFVFRYNGGEMPLATLAYSKLIIDEIQMYSKELVAIILVALKEITDLGGKFAIITATFPPVLYEFMKKYKVIETPLMQKTFHSEFSQRHRIKVLDGDEFDYDNILELAKRKKVLVIANTVKRAQKIYDKLLNTQGVQVNLLHSSFIKRDRAILEASIMKFAPNDNQHRNEKTGIWISTQIVEASLDIDFDVLFTEMCTIDSLLQRMGRVYRSRLYNLGLEPNIFILDGKNGYGTVVDPEIYQFSLAAVKRYDGQLLEESDELDLKQAMINQVYDAKENPNIVTSRYYRGIDEKIRSLLDLKMYELNKKDAQKQFRDIQSISVIPRNIFEELKGKGQVMQWMQELEAKGTTNGRRQLIKDEILQYTINLSHYEQEYAFFVQEGKLCETLEIYVYEGDYKFDTQNHQGQGLIRKRQKNASPQTAPAEFM